MRPTPSVVVWLDWVQEATRQDCPQDMGPTVELAIIALPGLETDINPQSPSPVVVLDGASFLTLSHIDFTQTRYLGFPGFPSPGVGAAQLSDTLANSQQFADTSTYVLLTP